MLVTQTLYFYCIHKYDLIFFLRLKEFLVDTRHSYRYEIVINEEIYSAPGVSDFVIKFFDSVKIIFLGSKERDNFFERAKKWFVLRYWIRRELDPKAILISLDKTSLISRVVLKQHRKIILIQQFNSIDESYKFSIRFFLLDSLRAIFSSGLLMKHYVNIKSHGMIRALSFFHFNKPRNIIYITEKISIKPSMSLPKIKKQAEAKKVVIFGSRFLSWDMFSELPKHIFADRIQSIYRQISKNLAVDYEVFYFPHPLEQGLEFELINKEFDGNLRVVKNYFSSEEFLLKNSDIAMTFSLGSTSSHSAFSMGFNSKVLYKLLKLKSSIEETYNNIFSGFPNAFFVKEYSELLTPCIKDDLSENMSDFMYMLKEYD